MCDKNTFLNDYEFLSIITSPYNDILWGLGNIDIFELPLNIKLHTKTGDYAALKYNVDTNKIYVVLTLNHTPDLQDYKKVNEIIREFNEKAKSLEDKGFSIKYKPPKNGMHFTVIKKGYKIRPKFLLPYYLYTCNGNQDIIYYSVMFTLKKPEMDDLLGTANKSLYTYRYEDCIGIRLKLYPSNGLKVNNVINKHMNKVVDAEGTYLDWDNCGYEYDSRGFTKFKYDEILEKTDRQGTYVIDKYEKIIFISRYYALDKKGKSWSRNIDYDNQIFFRYYLDFQVFNDNDNIFSIKKKAQFLSKYL